MRVLSNSLASFARPWFGWLPRRGELKFDKVICIQCAQKMGVMDGEPEPMTEAQRLEVALETGLHNDELDRAWHMAVQHFKRGGT